MTPIERLAIIQGLADQIEKDDRSDTLSQYRAKRIVREAQQLIEELKPKSLSEKYNAHLGGTEA